MLEKEFQKRVKSYLKDKGAYVVNYIAMGMYSTKGIPDLLVCYKGEFIGLELKMGTHGYGATALQLANIELINKAGGRGYVFTWSKDWKIELDVLLEDNKQNNWVVI